MQIQQQYAGSLNLLSFKRILIAAVSGSVDVGSMWCVYDGVSAQELARADSKV